VSRALELASAQARAAGLGVSLSEIRFERVDVPDAERAAIFTRMRSGADVEAAQIRAGGDEQRREIQSAADRDASMARAEGQKQAQIIRGQGDAKAAAILAASYGRDPTFAAFYRSMQRYETILGQGDTTLVLSPDSPLFKYLNAPER
jgi:membrane protease subunit HflC